MGDRAVVLFSGGIDSATTLAIAQSRGYSCYALSFDYSQRHSIELELARKFIQSSHVSEHRVVKLDIAGWGGSALTDASMDVPTAPGNMPSTYVPARNMIFLSTALAWAEVLSANVIFFGANKQDFANYPDCRPDFFSSFEKTASLATRIGDGGQKIVVETPLIQSDKSEIIGLGLDLNVNYALTWSCYNPQGEDPCLSCDACMMRQQGFAGLNIADPLLM
jgi:7-cyano-7-deazaguanine synthase